MPRMRRDPDIAWQFPNSRRDRARIAFGGAVYFWITVIACGLLLIFR